MCRSPVLSFFNPEGELLWKTAPYACGYCKTDDVAFAANGDILVGGDWKRADDYGTEEDGLAVARFDILGNRLAYQKMAYYPISPPVRLLELPGGAILATSGHYLFGFSAQLDSLFTRAYSLEHGEYYLDLLLAQDTTLVLLTNRRLFLANWQGEIQQELLAPSSNPLLDMAVASENLLYLTADTLYFYNLDTGSSSSVPLPSGDWQGLAIGTEAEVFLWGEAIHFLDTQTGWEELLQLSVDQKTIKKLVYKDGIFYRGGEDVLEPLAVYYNNLQLGYVEKLNSFTMPGNNDIGVSNVQMLELLSQNPYEESPGMYLISYQVRIGIEVTNYGNSEVSSFIVASKRQGGFNCAEVRFFQRVDNAALLPGETVLVEDILTEWRWADTPNPSFSLERCFFTGGPNHQFDRDFSNNGLCGNVLVQADEPEEALPLRLFPNPAGSMLYVELGAGREIEAFEWLNAAGQRVGQGRITPASRLELRRPGPPGLYWLRIVSREGVVSRPVVWQ